MQKIIEQPPQEDALKIAMILKNLGFNIEFLGSKTYDLKKLQSLDQVDLMVIREAFSKYNHPRFMKYFFAHQPFGKRQEYTSKILNASLETLAHLIKICGFLLQTKVYLFWEKPAISEERIIQPQVTGG